MRPLTMTMAFRVAGTAMVPGRPAGVSAYKEKTRPRDHQRAEMSPYLRRLEPSPARIGAALTGHRRCGESTGRRCTSRGRAHRLSAAVRAGVGRRGMAGAPPRDCLTGLRRSAPRGEVVDDQG